MNKTLLSISLWLFIAINTIAQVQILPDVEITGENQLKTTLPNIIKTNIRELHKDVIDSLRGQLPISEQKSLEQVKLEKNIAIYACASNKNNQIAKAIFNTKNYLPFIFLSSFRHNVLEKKWKQNQINISAIKDDGVIQMYYAWERQAWGTPLALKNSRIDEFKAANTIDLTTMNAAPIKIDWVVSYQSLSQKENIPTTKHDKWLNNSTSIDYYDSNDNKLLLQTDYLYKYWHTAIFFEKRIQKENFFLNFNKIGISFTQKNIIPYLSLFKHYVLMSDWDLVFLQDSHIQKFSVLDLQKQYPWYIINNKYPFIITPLDTQINMHNNIFTVGGGKLDLITGLQIKYCIDDKITIYKDSTQMERKLPILSKADNLQAIAKIKGKLSFTNWFIQQDCALQRGWIPKENYKIRQYFPLINSMTQIGFKKKLVSAQLNFQQSFNLLNEENKYIDNLYNLECWVSYKFDSKIDVKLSGENLLNQKLKMIPSLPIEPLTFWLTINTSFFELH